LPTSNEVLLSRNSLLPLLARSRCSLLLYDLGKYATRVKAAYCRLESLSLASCLPSSILRSSIDLCGGLLSADLENLTAKMNCLHPVEIIKGWGKSCLISARRKTIERRIMELEQKKDANASVRKDECGGCDRAEEVAESLVCCTATLLSGSSMRYHDWFIELDLLD